MQAQPTHKAKCLNITNCLTQKAVHFACLSIIGYLGIVTTKQRQLYLSNSLCSLTPFISGSKLLASPNVLAF